jgi:2-methylisocitrate lyase-like PEP mutase family enzyme
MVKMGTRSEQQYNKGEAFRELHSRPEIFVIPNPWDITSAKILSTLGYEALSTTSAGLAIDLERLMELIH